MLYVRMCVCVRSMAAEIFANLLSYLQIVQVRSLAKYKPVLHLFTKDEGLGFPKS